MIGAVIFDVGECLVDETTEYGTWADWLGVPRHTFHAMFGAVIAQGRDHRETFQEFRPGFDLYEERGKRAQAGKPEHFGEADLYPDVRDALATLRADGLWLGIAGNQTVRPASPRAQPAPDLRHQGAHPSLACRTAPGACDRAAVTELEYTT